jgi:atypical dual specificity phosphatase
MFVKYEKTYHVFPVTSKYNLDNTTFKRLLAGEVVVEEKMDGSNTGIIRHSKGFSLQKRNSLVGPSVHEQFDYFYNWANTVAYDRIMSVPGGYLIYGELLYAVHHIVYDRLPEYFLVFDIRDNGSWLNYNERAEFCQEHGFHMVPLVARGAFTADELHSIVPVKSAYGALAEGVVVKRYAKHGYFRGKIVKPGFIKVLEEDDEHWSRKGVRRNGLAIERK